MPTVVPTVEESLPNAPAAVDVKGSPGCVRFACVVVSPSELLGSAFGRVLPTPAKFEWLKRLKISKRSSPWTPLRGPTRLATTASTCQKFGPWIELRSRLPFVPGFGVAHAAGFRDN